MSEFPHTKKVPMVFGKIWPKVLKNLCVPYLYSFFLFFLITFKFVLKNLFFPVWYNIMVGFNIFSWLFWAEKVGGKSAA